MNQETIELVQKSAARVERVEAETKSLNDRFEKTITEIAQKLDRADAFVTKKSLPNPLADLEKSPQLAELRNRSIRSMSFPLNGSLRMIRKAIVGDAGTTDDSPFSVQPAHDERFANDPRRPLRLVDVLGHIRVESNAFTFNRLDGYNNFADVQAYEGANKAVTTVPTTLATANIVTIAHYVKASRQVLADAPALRMQIDSLLNYGTLLKFEDQLVNGPGGTEIDGLVNQATSFVQSTDSGKPDAIGEAIASLESGGWRAGVILMNPADWFAIRSERSQTEKIYVASGWSQPADPSIWGVPVVSTPSLAQGKTLIIDPSQVAILDRQDARLEIGFEGSDFTTNMATMLSEMRGGLAVFSPAAVVLVNF